MLLVVLDAATFGEISLEPVLAGFTSTICHDETSPDQVGPRLAQAGVAVTNKVPINGAVMRACPHLKLICVAATGTDKIDLEAAASLGIQVSNVPGYSTASVICHTFALYFHLAHHSPYYDNFTKSRSWSDTSLFTHLGRSFDELAGKVWAVLGLGAIGSGVARVAQSFGCRVVYHSTSGRNLDQPYPQMELAELLAVADILSIHAPLNAATRGIIDANRLALLKPNAILINTSRGGIVDERALAHALDEGRIAAAGLDVLTQEPPPADHPLLSLAHPDRLLLTPHIAWASRESRRRLIDEIGLNIQAFIAGKARHPVV